MKPKNFPQRKQERRESARGRLIKRWLKNGESVPHDVAREMTSLDKSLEQGSQRDVRTKKFRG